MQNSLIFVGIVTLLPLQQYICFADKALPVVSVLPLSSPEVSAFNSSIHSSQPLLDQNWSLMNAYLNDSVSPYCSRDWHLLLQHSKSFRRQAQTTISYLQHPIYIVGSTWPESFQDCLELQINHPARKGSRPIVGQYCIAHFLNADTDLYTYEEKLLGTNKFPIVSQADTIPNLGVCIPATCSPQDVKTIFEQLVNEVRWNVSVKVPSNYCQTKITQPSATALTYYVWLVLVTVCIMVIFGTAIDWWICWQHQQQMENIPIHRANGHTPSNGFVANGVHVSEHVKLPNGIPYTNGKKKRTNDTSTHWTSIEILRCFSIYTNGHALFTTTAAEGSVETIHGLRFISLLAMIIAHTLSTSVPFTYKDNSIIHHSNQVLVQMIQNTGLFNDTFFFISGFLAAFVNLKKMHANGGRLGIFSFYWYRWMRLTPPYAFYLAFTMGVLVLFSGSPRWPHFMMEVENCKQNWWLNMLYINNFFGADAMCQLHFWYLATVMQLHLIAPLLLYALYKYPKLGISLAFGCLAFSNITHGAITYFHNLPPAPFILLNLPGEKIHQYLVDVHFPVYIKLGSYAIGMVVGRWILLHGNTLKMKPLTAFLIWPPMFVVGFGISIFALGRYFYPGEITPSIYEAALYAGTSRAIWNLCITFLIVMHHIGRGGIFTRFLTWGFFKPLSRLTYCAYIIHYNLLFIYFVSRPAPLDFTQWNVWYYFVGTVISSFFLAIPLSLGFEFPAMRLAKLIEKLKN